MSTQALARNTILQIASKLLGMLFGIATFYLMLQYFGTDGYGYFTIAVTHVTIFAILVDFGLTLTTTQMISEPGADEKTILGNLLSLRIVSAATFMTLAPLTALFIPQSAPVMDLIIVASFTYFFGSIAATFVGVFQKRLKIGFAVLAETTNRLVSMVGVIVAGYFSFGLKGAAIAFLLGNLLQMIIMLAATHNTVKLRPQWDIKVWKDILLRSWPIGLSIFFNLIYLRGDVFFLWIFNRTAYEIGQYGAAYKVLDVITIIPITLMGLVLPILTAAWATKNVGLFRKRLQDSFDSLAAIAIPFACGAAILGVPLMTAIKPDLVLAGKFLLVLGPTATVVFFGSMYGHAIVAINKQRSMTLGYIAVAIVAIAGYVLYIPTHGAWAAAWTSLIAESLIAAITFYLVTRVTHIVPNGRLLFKIVLASICMSLVIAFVPLPHVILSVVLGIVTYGLVLAVVGGPKPYDLIKLFRAEETPLTP